MKTTTISLFTALAGLALTGAVVFEGGPDPVVFPPQDVPIRFTHDYHVRKAEAGQPAGEGLSCDFCHEKVASSTQASTRDIPGHESCENCHEEWIGSKDKPASPELCSKCHTDPAVAISSESRSRLDIPTPNIRFAHKSHVDAGVACTDCHVNVPAKAVATRDDYPTMDRCIACHEARGVSTACKTCHLSNPSGRLVTEFAAGKLEPRRLHAFAIHDGDFLRDHAAPAKRDRVYCNNCHSQPFCLSCHDGVARDVRYHPGDWISQHALRAKKDDYRCQSCHRLQTFCLDCHVRSGVASVTANGVVPLDSSSFSRRTVRLTDKGQPAGPHPMAPDGWLNPASKNFHGFLAQRNIQSCVSCHQEQFCIQCHSTPAAMKGGFHVNPHGPNPERLSGSTARRRSARMCLKCHSPTDPSWR